MGDRIKKNIYTILPSYDKKTTSICDSPYWHNFVIFFFSLMAFNNQKKKKGEVRQGEGKEEEGRGGGRGVRK